uniref:Reverse transcriptase n=1 Tax=Cannabis sativa TaxID=3483 RepID=A0A803QQN3_CANSA
MKFLLQNISAYSKALQHWHNNKYGQMKRNIDEAQKKSAGLHNSSDSSPSHVANMIDTEKILDDLLEKEDLYWQQRAKIDWLKSGDSITKKNHARAKSRYNNNKIKTLLDSNERTLHSDAEFATEALNHFSLLFTSIGVDDEALTTTLEAINPTITNDMNRFLLKEFTRTDVDDALHSMAPDKSPGIDGISALFYQRHWDVVGPLVLKCMLQILNDGDDIEAINSALITLIPKVEQPIRLTTSQNQSAFLPRRLITDNVLLAFELVHCLKNKKRGCLGYVALKLDMIKAFDRVERIFLKKVMLKMGFDVKWVDLIMRCVSSSTLSFNINGVIHGSVTPQRGLRHGDPLSPYLFLICSEGLSALLQKQEDLGNLKGLSISRNSPSHVKLFSIGGREILLKAVVQSIPTYAMSCFSLPKKFCQQIESMMENFWWGSNTNKSKIHWKKWSLLCQSKAEGDLGFCSFLHFNQTLLTKQAWRIFDDPNSLLARVLKARLKHGDFLTASKGNLPSLTWKSICDGRDLLVKGLRWKIGLGNKVQCASNPWLPGTTSFILYSYCGDYRILAIPLSSTPREDKLFWHHYDNGIYSIKTGYHLAESIGKMNDSSSSYSNRSWWNRLWSLTLPKKVKIFAWRVINNAIPTAANLHRCKITPTAACSLCNCHWESIGHARDQVRCGHKPNSTILIPMSATSMALIFSLTQVHPISDSGSSAKIQRPAHASSINYNLRTPITWKPPPPGSFRLNVVRRLIVMDRLLVLELGVKIVKEMEANGLIHSLKWALENGLNIDFVEIDYFHDLIDDISLLSSYFPRVVVSHVKHDANRAAHDLARFALRLDNSYSWLRKIPSPIHSIIVMDSIH